MVDFILKYLYVIFFYQDDLDLAMDIAQENKHKFKSISSIKMINAIDMKDVAFDFMEYIMMGVEND